MYLSDGCRPTGAEWPSESLLNGIDDLRQTGVESASPILPKLAGSVEPLIDTNGANVFVDGVDERLDVVRIGGQNRLRHLRKQREERATLGLGVAADAFHGPVRADGTNAVPNNALEFLQCGFHFSPSLLLCAGQRESHLKTRNPAAMMASTAVFSGS
jgi:hypothetical protein